MQEQTQELQNYQPEEETNGTEIIIGTDAVVDRLMTGHLPLHMVKLHELQGYTAEQKAELAAIYDGIPEDIKTMGNMVLEVYGAIVYEHLPYMGKDGLPKRGYFYALLLCREMETDRFFIARSGGSGLTMHVMNMITLRERDGLQGWYLWDNPVRYKVAIDRNNGHHLVNVDRPSVLKNKTTKK